MSEEQEYDPDDILAELEEEDIFADESEEEDEDTAELDFETAHATEVFLDMVSDDLEEEAA